MNPTPSVMRKNFIQETQTFIISKTPYDISLPDEITQLPQKKGFFERFLRKIVGTFQNCRKKPQKNQEFMDFSEEEFKSANENGENDCFCESFDEKSKKTQNFAKKSKNSSSKEKNDENLEVFSESSFRNEKNTKKSQIQANHGLYNGKHDQNLEFSSEKSFKNLSFCKNEDKNAKHQGFSRNDPKDQFHAMSNNSKNLENHEKNQKTEKIITKNEKKVDFEEKGSFGFVKGFWQRREVIEEQPLSGEEYYWDDVKRRKKQKFSGKRKRMQKLLKRKSKKNKQKRQMKKYRHEVDLSGFPRKKIHENIDMKDMVKIHQKYDLTSLDFNDSNDDDTQSEQSSKNAEVEITKKIYSKLEENDKFHGLNRPEIILEITRQGDDETKEKRKISSENIATPKPGILKTEEEILSFSGKRSGKKETLFLEPQPKQSTEGASRKESLIIVEPAKSEPNKPSSRKTSIELQKTPPKPEISQKSEQLQASERKISLSEDKTHIFEQKPQIFPDLNPKIANIENTPNHENLPKSFEIPLNQSTPKKTPASPKLDDKSKEINPFLTPQSQIISESLTDYISKASGAGKFAPSDALNNSNIEKNPFLMMPSSATNNNTQIFQNFGTNNAMNAETPTNNNNNPFTNSNFTNATMGLNNLTKNPMQIIQEPKPIFSDFTVTNTPTIPNTLINTTSTNSLGNFGFPLSTSTPPPDFYPPPKLLHENSSTYLSQNSTTSNGLFAGLLGQTPGIPSTFSPGFANKPSGGIFGNLLANSSGFDSFKQNNPSEGAGIFGGLLAGMKESSGSSVSKNFNKKRKPRVNS